MDNTQTETASEHVRNALTMLAELKQHVELDDPANEITILPRLAEIDRRMRAALAGIERTNAASSQRPPLSAELHTAVEMLQRAIVDEGPHPDTHRAIMGATRRSWPSLMSAVDFVLAAYSKVPR